MKNKKKQERLNNPSSKRVSTRQPVPTRHPPHSAFSVPKAHDGSTFLLFKQVKYSTHLSVAHASPSPPPRPFPRPLATLEGKIVWGEGGDGRGRRRGTCERGFWGAT